MTESVSAIKRGTVPLTACARCRQERTGIFSHCKERPCGWWRCTTKGCGWVNGPKGAIRGGAS